MNKLSIKKKFTFSILLMVWAFLSLIFIYSKTNITVISKIEDKNVLTKTKFTEILKGEKIEGHITASENYLGQIWVRFYNYDRINKDEVDFRLLNGNSLIYEHVYKTDQFLPNGLFTFGFPVIPDSKGKNYRFEITSVAGKPEDAITLSSESPLVATSYQYPKQLLFKNPSLALEFLSKKISYTNYNRDFIFSAVEYLIFISLSLVLIYLLTNQIFEFKLNKLKKLIGELVIVSGLVLISISAVLYYLKAITLSENLTIYGYFLLIIGVFLLLIKAKTSK